MGAWEETSSAAYIAKTAAEKNAIIAANVIEDTTPGDWYGILEMPGLFTESMCPTLRAPGDELPFEEGIISDGTRYKYIHTVGTVGQVEWKDLGGHSYSGIFNGGSVNGWARLSQAKEPSPPALDTAPAMGLKFLRDGIDSANLVAMYSVNGQEGWNFFQNDFPTHLGPAGLELIPVALKFSEATNYVQEVGGVETHIGDLVLTGAITTSMWGDKNLFFRHQDMADDVALKPEWEEYLDKFGIEHESGCPMMNMIKNTQRKGRVGDNL